MGLPKSSSSWCCSQQSVGSPQEGQLTVLRPQDRAKSGFSPYWIEAGQLAACTKHLQGEALLVLRSFGTVDQFPALRSYVGVEEPLFPITGEG